MGLSGGDSSLYVPLMIMCMCPPHRTELLPRGLGEIQNGGSKTLGKYLLLSPLDLLQ